MESLKQRIDHLVHTNDREGLEDLQIEIEEVLDFTKRSVARTLNETVIHHRNVEQAESNLKLINNAKKPLV